MHGDRCHDIYGNDFFKKCAAVTAEISQITQRNRSTMEKEIANMLNALRSDNFVRDLTSRDQEIIQDFFLDYFCGSGDDDYSGKH